MDIRTQRTRWMLRDALQELLAEKSFEDISVSEICELSTVRRGTFYRHFDDKFAFYQWYLQSMTEQFMSELDDQLQGDDLRTYTSLMHRKLIEFAKEHKAIFGHNLGKTAMAGSLDMVMRQAALGIAERVAAYLEASGTTGTVPVVPLFGSPEFISMFYSGGMVHTLRWWIVNDEPCSAEDLERHCTAFLMRYLGAE